MVALSASDLPRWTAGSAAKPGDLVSVCGKGVGVAALTTGHVESGLMAPNGIPVVVRVSRTGAGKAQAAIDAATASMTDCPGDVQGDLLTTAALTLPDAGATGVGANLLTTNGAGTTTDSRGYFITSAGTDLVVEVLVVGEVSIAGDLSSDIMTSFSEAVTTAAMAKVSGKAIPVPAYPDLATAAGIALGNATAGATAPTAPAGDGLGNSAGPGNSSGDATGGAPTP